MFQKMVAKIMESKVVKWIFILVPFFALFEGIEHIVMSSVSFWGILATHIHDWRVWANPSFDFFAGGINIITGIYLKMKEKKKPSE